ncbi:MAG TPA: hypothetical protein VHI13_17525 [Candidatus Kapabacteria bacterium]|nr:hypothetical protein [Candidatus Kapabacteria bacterium]
MIIEELVRVDYFRDGGSYQAIFATDDGLGYGLWLACSRTAERSGPRHRWLFEYRGYERPPGCVPVISESPQEHAIVERVREALAHRRVAAGDDGLPAEWHIERLQDMLASILVREHCSREDLIAEGFIQ